MLFFPKEGFPSKLSLPITSCLSTLPVAVAEEKLHDYVTERAGSPRAKCLLHPSTAPLL